MRLFVALPLPQALRDHLGGIITALSEHWNLGGDNGRWVSHENLHVTLKFLGEVPDADVPAVTKALRDVRVKGAIEFHVSQLLFQPRRGRARLLAAELSGDAGRAALLHRAIDEAMHGIGFAHEGRAFWPHVTLARFRPPIDPREVEGPGGEPIDQVAKLPGPSGEAERFELIQSVLRREGPLYVPLASYALDSGPAGQLG